MPHPAESQPDGSQATLERALAERALSEERYLLLVGNLAESIVELTPEGEVLFANRIPTGHGLASSVGQSVLNWVPEEARSAWQRLLRRVHVDERQASATRQHVDHGARVLAHRVRHLSAVGRGRHRRAKKTHVILRM